MVEIPTPEIVNPDKKRCLQRNIVIVIDIQKHIFHCHQRKILTISNFTLNLTRHTIAPTNEHMLYHILCDFIHLLVCCWMFSSQSKLIAFVIIFISIKVLSLFRNSFVKSFQFTDKTAIVQTLGPNFSLKAALIRFVSMIMSIFSSSFKTVIISYPAAFFNFSFFLFLRQLLWN